MEKTLEERMTKEEIQRIALLAIKSFLEAHPDALDKDLIQSVAKRVAGQIYTHFIHNPKNNGG